MTKRTRYRPAIASAAALALLLAACASDEDRKAEIARQNAIDHQHCLDLGFEEGTEAYGNCRLKLREIRAQEGSKGSDTHFGVGIGVGIGL